ncbi:Methyl-accepting chemotaxis protein [Burkholderia pseudomallei]|nr:Methyl-accepting chemotaxis protein [Burkholderia pseudomallei]CAJ3737591.1 Methyl-accepting chemotaxis protein [Burkholderia pseudomallei]CAJ6380320.1 Methyl-accepting chemotaxis protein [Burkholderia pseudomallei]CAJ7242472.1 Methyl-accepting chemotaxis protein [Burkholderia pseudomallei]CAJ8195685.1 Methyl-accepting chemotaxis protein [Burkholderia pseudomallei]
MSRFHVHLVVFFAGLAAVCWIGAGYAVSNPVALAVTLVIAAGYLAGALELRRYRQATSTLAQAVAALSEPPAALGAWLERLHPSLRHAVRVRVEGERVALPGPALTPYLVGLLVLLGMLGTLIGMVMTLRGTGAALESSTDLQAIRASLAAPVKGLGFAFGTSIAGVATSAMLGLLSALCRRERLDAAQALDAKIATTLRVHSHAHQRDETFRLLQRQADLMPTLVERLQAMMHSLEQQSAASAERQIAGQQAFLGKAEETYARLASSVGQSLTDSVAESARVAGSALQPVMETTMAGLARETAALHDALTQAVQRQLDGLSAGFETTAAHVADVWRHALADHQRSSDALAQRLHGSIDRIVESFDRRSADLLDGVRARLDATASSVSDAWRGALAQQEQANEAHAERNRQALETAAATFERHSAALLRTIGESHSALQATLESRDEQRLATWTDSLGSIAAKLGTEWAQTSAQAANRQQAICDALAHTSRDLSAQATAFEQHTAALLRTMSESHSALQATLESRDEQRLATWTDSLGSIAAKLGTEWAQTSAQAANRQQTICDALAHTSRDLSAQATAFEQHTAALLRAMSESHSALQATLESRDEQRLATWTDSLGSIAAKLGTEWEQTSAQAANRQQAIYDALAHTARDLSAHTQAHASATIAEISQLVQAASEAPRVAAEVVAELRQKLSDSMVRDTAMLEERNRMLATLETLLDAVNHASSEQRAAVDALVATSSALLQRVGTQFTDEVGTQTDRLGGVAAQITGSAVEIASLGDALGAAVQSFGESNDKLVAHLQRIEAALDKSLARSDEQLAYYVAQAREVIDLSMMSQKQIIEELQRVGGERASAGAAAA